MKLPDHKTKIVATIGPASSSPEMISRLILAGMNVARLNFSHGDFEGHGEVIAVIRREAARLERTVAIMADLPGPKMRIGRIEPGPVTLVAGGEFILTTRDVAGDATIASVSFESLPRVVKTGDRLFLNDGLVQVLVERVEAGTDVHCRVAVGGELSTRKGLNLPGIALGISAFTSHDRKCLEFAMRCGIDAVSQSFVEGAADIDAVREAASEFGPPPFLIAKIERSDALAHIDEILETADGIMVARGDLGVEVPIEEIAMLQKQLIAKARLAGKPVITATQMLESMITSRLPTRAEATDVANAILDGTDAVMLSGESAAGRFPEESVRMLASIAAYTEERAPQFAMGDADSDPAAATPFDRMARLAERALGDFSYDALVVPTRTGLTARLIARNRPPVWILAVASHPDVVQSLVFSRGIHAVEAAGEPADWFGFVQDLMEQLEVPCRHVIFVAGPSTSRPLAHQRIEFFDFSP